MTDKYESHYRLGDVPLFATIRGNEVHQLCGNELDKAAQELLNEHLHHFQDAFAGKSVSHKFSLVDSHTQTGECITGSFLKVATTIWD